MPEEENNFDDPKTIWDVLALLIRISNSLSEKKKVKYDAFQIFAMSQYPPISLQQVEYSKKAPWKFSANSYIHLPSVEIGGWRQQPVVRASFESQGDLQVFRFQVVEVQVYSPVGARFIPHFFL